MDAGLQTTLLVICLLLPLVGAVGVQLLGRFVGENARDAWTVVVGLATFSQVVRLVGPVMDGARPALALPGWMPGLGLGFEVEPLGLLFALVASGLWVLTSLYGFGYMRGHHEKNQTRFFTCFAIAIAAALGIAFAGDLVTLFLFYEILTFSTYPLVTHAGTDAAVKAGRLYLGILVSTSVLFLLLAILWTSTLAGDLGFHAGVDRREAGGAARRSGRRLRCAPVAAPLLLWRGQGGAHAVPSPGCPTAMVAPTPVSALLHAVAVVKAGVFSVLKVIGVRVRARVPARRDGLLGPRHAVSRRSRSTLPRSPASLALTKDNLKARLAYSTVSQLSYIVLGGDARHRSRRPSAAGMHIADPRRSARSRCSSVAGAIIRRRSQDPGERAQRPRPQDAAHHGRLLPRQPRSASSACPPSAARGASGTWRSAPPTPRASARRRACTCPTASPTTCSSAVLMISSLLSIGYLMPDRRAERSSSRRTTTRSPRTMHADHGDGARPRPSTAPGSHVLTPAVLTNCATAARELRRHRRGAGAVRTYLLCAHGARPGIVLFELRAEPATRCWRTTNRAAPGMSEHGDPGVDKGWFDRSGQNVDAARSTRSSSCA